MLNFYFILLFCLFCCLCLCTKCVKDRGGEAVHKKFCVWEVGEGEFVRARVNITIKSMN